MKLTPIVAAALVAGALAAPAAQASAPLHCGATITKDTKLNKDLSDCPGVGIRIGADGITLDLDGHTIAAALPAQWHIYGPPTAHFSTR